MEGCTCQMFARVHWVERFTLDKKNYDIANEKTDFELDLCTNDEHVAAKMYKCS